LRNIVIDVSFSWNFSFCMTRLKEGLLHDNCGLCSAFILLVQMLVMCIDACAMHVCL
jgi:hypothetical protein